MEVDVDPVLARIEAVRILRGILMGTVADPGALKRGWPPITGPDALLRRAYYEAQHFFAVRGAALQRRVLELVIRFLEEGGTPEQFSAAYDRAVQETGGCFSPD